MKVASAVSAIMLTISGPAMAGCKDDVARLDSRASEKAKSSIATASGGQGTAARREAEPAGRDKGEQAMRAKVALNDAHVALSKGDEAACNAAIAKVRFELGTH